MKILITGGNGFVGKNIPYGYKLTRTDCNLLDKEATIKFITEYAPTHVIHTAGRIGGVYGNMNAKGQYYFENILINTHVLEAARLANVEKVISLLSTCIFPDDPKLMPYKEEYLHLGEPHTTNYGYAFAKRMLDVQSKMYREQYGCNFVSITPVNLYGAHDHFNVPGSHVVPALIHKCIEAKHSGTPFKVLGSGKALREFLYIEDLSKFLDMAINEYNDPDTIIFSTAIETSIEDLSFIIAQAANFTGDIIFDSSYTDGQYRKPSDISKFKRLFPNFEFTSLYDGIKRTVDWYEEIYSNNNN